MFVVITGTASDPVYTAYTGIANVPTIKGGSSKSVTYAYYTKTSGMITFAVIDARNAAEVTTSSKDVIFVLGNATAKQTIDSNSDYYTFNAVINGEITTIKVATSQAALITALKAGSHLYTTANYDTYGVATSLTADSTVQSMATGTHKTSSGAVGIGYASNTYYTYSSTVKVFKVNTDGDLEASSTAAIRDDINDQVFYTYKDGEVTNIFIVPVGGDAAATLSASTLSVAPNATGTITVSGLATGASVTGVSSSDTSIATVSYSSGTVTVTGVKAGTATVTVTVTGANASTASYTCAVTVA